MQIRLYHAEKLTSGDTLKLDKPQAHYLTNVLRCREGTEVLLFNGYSGEFKATFNGREQLKISDQTRNPVKENKLTLLFAPVKFGKIDMLVQKATELGVTKLQPVQTRFTVIQRINYDRMLANAIEAAEQTGRLSVPEIVEIQTLDKLIDGWSAKEKIIFCDESGAGKPLAKVLETLPEKSKDLAVLIGPEGGFAKEETAMLNKKKFVLPVSMGKRILRSETAAVAALAVVQAVAGDWTK